MFKRLIVLCLLMLAIITTSPTAQASTLTAGAYCLPTGHGRTECHASASGGTGIYTYTWAQVPFAGGGSLALFYCTPYQYNSYTVTVTDSNGATASAEGWTECGDAV